LDQAEKLDMKALFAGTPEYPKLLSQLPDRPPVIYAIGNLETLNKKTIAIVGSRHASTNSKTFASNLSRELAIQDYAVVSGMAIGIDTAVHQGTIASGKLACTIAVLGCGADVIYPASNRDLYKVIAQNHLVISEMPPGTKPSISLFPRRNRLISGLSQGVVIAEASIKSGSLITARFALDQNREVFAVPGSPVDPRSGGTNYLIKNGACLIESSTDIITELESQNFRTSKPKKFELNEEAITFEPTDIIDIKDRILSLLGPGETSANVLLRDLSDTPRALVSNALLELELDDKIEYSINGNITAKL